MSPVWHGLADEQSWYNDCPVGPVSTGSLASTRIRPLSSVGGGVGGAESTCDGGLESATGAGVDESGGSVTVTGGTALSMGSLGVGPESKEATATGERGCPESSAAGVGEGGAGDSTCALGVGVDDEELQALHPTRASAATRMTDERNMASFLEVDAILPSFERTCIAM